MKDGALRCSMHTIFKNFANTFVTFSVIYREGGEIMRKTWIHLIVLFPVLFAACSKQSTTSSLNVTIDPRIELLAAVQSLSDYGEKFSLLTSLDYEYKKDLMQTFQPYAEHEAVKLFQEMSHSGFTFDAPPTVMLHLDSFPELAVEQPFTDYLIGRAGGEKKLMRFIEHLRDFAEQTHFMAFFQKHEEFYQKTLQSVNENFQDIDFIGVLEGYYGQKQHSYNIILAPMFSGNYGPRISRGDGTYDIFNIVSPRQIKDDILYFGSKANFEHLAWHEFSHSFVNPLGEIYRKELLKYASLFKPIQSKMSASAYGNWITTVNEHVVRAVTTRLNYLQKGNKEGDRVLLGEKTYGFAYIEALCKKLEFYEEKRNKYPTFSSFYPELIKTFKELSEMHLGRDFYLIPFNGTINAVTINKDDVILVVPTNEKDKTAQDKIHEYVKMIKGRFYKENPLLTDTDALNRDLSKHAVVMYGTTEGNLLLAKYIKGMPFKIESDKVVANKVYEGENLKFITAWPNPHNTKRGFLIYTAQKAEDIPEINSVFHGPTDYVIAQKSKILHSSDYKKDNAAWIF